MWNVRQDYLAGSVTGLQSVLQLSFSCLEPSALFAQNLALACQLSAQLAAGRRLRLQQTLSLTQLSTLGSQSLQASLQGRILLLKLLALLIQLPCLKVTFRSVKWQLNQQIS